MMRHLKFIAGILALALAGCGDAADNRPTLTIAVASNFLATARAIGAEFSEISGADLVFVSGSTGKLVAQITQGAPFDLFLSADTSGPAHLFENCAMTERKPETYAIGRLVLFSHNTELLETSIEFPESNQFQHLAIANPRLAPYGRAAKESLKKLGIWDSLQDRIVRGENISQTWHFVSSRNADLGLVALSQVKDEDSRKFRLIPREHHTPIEQDAILVNDTELARRFLQFLNSPVSRRIIQSHGYDLPPLPHAE